MSGGAGVFVDQSAPDRFSADLLCADVGHGGAGSVRFVAGDVLSDALVRSSRVVVHLVLGQDGAQMPLAAVHSPVAARYPPAGSRPRGSRWPARAGTAARSDPSGAAPDRCPQHAGSPTRWTARPSRRASSVRRGCGGVPIADSLSPPGRRGGDARACRRAAGRAPLARVVFARSQPAVPGQRHRICFLKRNRCRGRVSPGPISPPSGRPAATKARFDSHLERRLPLEEGHPNGEPVCGVEQPPLNMEDRPWREGRVAKSDRGGRGDP